MKGKKKSCRKKGFAAAVWSYHSGQDALEVERGKKKLGSALLMQWLIDERYKDQGFNEELWAQPDLTSKMWWVIITQTKEEKIKRDEGGMCEQHKGRRSKEREKSILQFILVESQKNIILLSSEGRSSVAKQARSSVTIFPLWNGRRDEERIALFPISLLLLVTHSSHRPIDLNFATSFLSALPRCHRSFIHNCGPAKWMLDNQ